MKFAALSLIAAASAIKVESEIDAVVEHHHHHHHHHSTARVCINKPSAANIFDIIDTNHSNGISPRELYTAIDEWAKATH